MLTFRTTKSRIGFTSCIKSKILLLACNKYAKQVGLSWILCVCPGVRLNSGAFYIPKSGSFFSMIYFFFLPSRSAIHYECARGSIRSINLGATQWLCSQHVPLYALTVASGVIAVVRNPLFGPWPTIHNPSTVSLDCCVYANRIAL